MKNIEDAEKKQIDEEEENPTQAAKRSKLSSIQCDKNEQDDCEMHRLSEKDAVAKISGQGFHYMYLGNFGKFSNKKETEKFYSGAIFQFQLY